jgi:hypothetical protein
VSLLRAWRVLACRRTKTKDIRVEEKGPAWRLTVAERGEVVSGYLLARGVGRE